MHLNLHHTEVSRINGPGLRLAIWVQGCQLGCKGCFNENTHSQDVSTYADVDELAVKINGMDEIDGITVSGGEPLDQAAAIVELVRAVRGDKTWILYTGYEPKEIFENPDMTRLVKSVDLTLAGRYRFYSAHPYQHKKLIKCTDRIDANYFQAKKTVELVVSSSGITKTGIVR